MRGIYFIDPEDEEYQETKTYKDIVGCSDGSGPCRARRKTQTSRGRRKLQQGEECPKDRVRLVWWKFREATRQRMEPTSRKGHEDHIAGKEAPFHEPFKLVHKFISNSESDENSGRNIIQRKFHTRWEKSSSPCVEHYDFLAVSCSRFFLWNRKQSAHSAMSKRRQEGSAGDSSPITNPRSVNLVISKPGSISLVPRNMSSYFSSRDMSDSESPEHVEVEPDSVRTRIWKHYRTRVPIQPNILKSGNRNRLNKVLGNKNKEAKENVLGNKSKTARVRTQRATGKQSAATYKSGKEFGTGQSPMHHYMGKVSLNLQKLGITEGSSVKELGPIVTNIFIRRSFMPDSMRAAIHLGQNNTENVAVFKNVHVEEIKNLFSITKVLVLGHSEEILDVQVTDSKDPSWKKQKISHPQVIKWTKAKVHVYSDSVLRLGELSALPDAAERWKGQLVDFQTTVSNQEFYGIDGELIEWKWNILPGLTSLAMLRKVQDHLQNSNIKPENFGDRIILMSMFNDTDWNTKNNEGECISKSEEIRDHAERFSQGHWTVLGQDM